MSRLDEAFNVLLGKKPNPIAAAKHMTLANSFIANHERRIADLEKQVAELRAALEEHLNPRTRKPRKGVDPNIYGSMLYD